MSTFLNAGSVSGAGPSSYYSLWKPSAISATCHDPKLKGSPRVKTKQNKHTGFQGAGEKIETNFINIFILSMC